MAVAAAAAASASLSLNGGVNCRKTNTAKGLGINLPQLTINHKTNQIKSRSRLTVCARREGSGGEGEFFAGFILGGAICGALAYYYAPQIRRAVMNEDEHRFRRPKNDMMDEMYGHNGIYSDVYVNPDKDGGLEKTRMTLNSKIKQLNNAIDNVSSKLKDKVSSTFPPPDEELIPKHTPSVKHDPDSDFKYGV